MPDLKINIHNTNNYNTIIEKEYPKFEESAIHLKSEGGLCAAKNVRILFEPSAVKPLFESIAWGGRYRYGDVEQAGMLIGNYYRDCTDQEVVIWADVVMVIPADPSLVNASFEAIDITATAWSKMFEDAAEFRTENLQIVGWYHTHLNNISTRFSSVDRSTQRKAFTYEYSFGVVFNPNKGKWSAFYGPDSQECTGELLLDETLAGRCEKPQITISQVNGDSVLQEDGSIVHVEEIGRQSDGCSLNGNAPNAFETDISSFGQRIGQWMNSVGQWLPRLIRRESGSGEAYVDWIAHTSPERSSDEQLLQRPSAGRSSEAPKIEIKKFEWAEPPRVECAFFSRGAADKLVKHLDVRCVASRGAIEEVMRCRQYALNHSQKDASLWGYVRQSGFNIEFLRVLTERGGNAKVIFINQNPSSENNKRVTEELQRCSRTYIKFAILVETDDLRFASIRIVQL